MLREQGDENPRLGRVTQPPISAERQRGAASIQL
jgi:hypothetical protein